MVPRGDIHRVLSSALCPQLRPRAATLAARLRHGAVVDLKTALYFCGGAARPERLREIGVSPQALRAGRRAGLVASRGTYALPDTPPAITTAVRLGGVVSHSTAALLHGFALWSPDPTIHVTVRSGSHDVAPGVRIHRGRLSSEDVDPFRPVTTPLRTLLDCGRTLPFVEAVVVMDSALHSGQVKLPELQAAAAAARGPGAAALRRAVRCVDPRAGSPLESVLRLGLWTLNCDLESQVPVEDVGDVDFVLDGWLAIEGDGFAYHSDRSAYRNDRSRGNALVLRRHVLLRFTYEDVRYRMDWVLDLVARVLAAGPPWVAVGTH